MDPLRISQEEGQESSRNNNGANQSYEATMARMMDFLERQESHRVRQDERMERMSRGENRRELEIATEDIALEKFLKFSPPAFGGTGNEEDAEKWLERMDKIYTPLQYKDERKIKFGVYQLEGQAETWWKIIEQRWELTGTPRTWNAFKEEFKAKFIPQIIRDKREEEFMYLKQRTMTVSQYETIFTRLAKYAPELVNTEEKRKKKFIRGLNVEIQNSLTIARVFTYAETVEMAQKIEDGQERLREFQNSRRTAARKVPIAGGEGSHGSRTSSSRMTRGIKRPAPAGKGSKEKKGKPPIVCRFCGKPNHIEAQCRRKGKRCLRCGSAEHQIQDCPRIATGSSGATMIAKRPEHQ